jgi:hypothetical protein
MLTFSAIVLYAWAFLSFISSFVLTFGWQGRRQDLAMEEKIVTSLLLIAAFLTMFAAVSVTIAANSP